jgi:hypothetical protein
MATLSHGSAPRLRRTGLVSPSNAPISERHLTVGTAWPVRAVTALALWGLWRSGEDRRDLAMRVRGLGYRLSHRCRKKITW